eukprot:scaffold4308_cov110-Cylindrotheca_fusiformis.AAC.3
MSLRNNRRGYDVLYEIRQNVITEFSLNQFVSKIGGVRVFMRIFEDFLRAMQLNSSIERANVILRFLDTRISEDYQLAFFKSLGSLSSLRALRVTTTSAGLTDSALTLLTTGLQFSNLESLCLQSIHPQRSRGGTANAGMSNDQEVLAKFCNTLRRQTRLQTFIMDDVEEGFNLDEIVDVLLSLRCLDTIILKSHMVSESYSREAMERLFQSSNARYLSINRYNLMDILPPLCVRIASNSTLRDLCLDEVGFSDEAGVALAQSLETNNILERLSVAYNHLSDFCGMALMRSLMRNQSLRFLNLAGNDIANETCSAIADLMVNNASSDSTSRLEYLNLSQNTLLQDDGVVTIASALSSNRSLKHLVLAETKLTGVSSAMMQASLRWNQTLEKLNLADNSLGDEGCSHMASLLESNTTLKQLNLSRNAIGDSGAIALAKVLRNGNSTLTALNISGNDRITVASYPELEAMMRENCTLEHFWYPRLPRPQDSSSIDSFLRLNKFGRKQLLQEMDNASFWIAAIEEFSNDILSLYYLIRTNPTVLLWLSEKL